jgi:hypothetical protein
VAFGSFQFVAFLFVIEDLKKAVVVVKNGPGGCRHNPAFKAGLGHQLQRCPGELMFKVVRKSGNVSLWPVQFLSGVIRSGVQVTEEAVKQARRKYQLARHPELCISQSPFLVVLTLFVHEIHCHSTPVSGEIVEQKAGDAHVSAAVPDSTIVFEISAKELPPDAIERFTVPYGKRLEEH